MTRPTDEQLAEAMRRIEANPMTDAQLREMIRASVIDDCDSLFCEYDCKDGEHCNVRIGASR